MISGGDSSGGPETAKLCEQCGAFGDMPHAWTEGDCVLPHRSHSRSLYEGSYVCVHCVDRWLEWLTELVPLYAGLNGVELAGSIPDTTAEHMHQKKAPASPSPLRLGAWALARPSRLKFWVTDDYGRNLEHIGTRGLPDVADILANWCEAIYGALEWGRGWPTTVSGSVACIQAQIGIVAGLPDVDTFDAELRWVRKALMNAHGLSEPIPVGRCLSVECGGNVWPQAGKQPKCDRCRRQYGTLDLVRLKAHLRKPA